MSLADIVEDRFLAEYIKKGMNILYTLSRHRNCILTPILGNVMMLSQGRIGVDNVFSLRQGMFSRK